MSIQLINDLDEALTRYQDQEPVPDILADFSDEAHALRPLLETAALLDSLKAVALPDEALLAADRALFMAHVNNLPPLPVSPGPVARLKGWMARNTSQPTRQPQKEYRPMGALLFKAILIFSMIFGAAGGTAALSSISQPDSPLYPLKLTVEGARLALAGQPAAQAALHLAFGQERAEEMAQMVQAGAHPDPAVQAQLHVHWQQALQLMAQSSESEMLDLLAQAQVMAQSQQALLTSAAASGGGEQAGDSYLSQVAAQVAFGLQEPQAFRQQGGIPTEMTGGRVGPGAGEPAGLGREEPPGPGLGGPNGPGDGEPNGPGAGEGAGPAGAWPWPW